MMVPPVIIEMEVFPLLVHHPAIGDPSFIKNHPIMRMDSTIFGQPQMVVSLDNRLPCRAARCKDELP